MHGAKEFTLKVYIARLPSLCLKEVLPFGAIGPEEHEQNIIRAAFKEYPKGLLTLGVGYCSVSSIEDLDCLKRTLDPILGYGIISHPGTNQPLNSFSQESTGLSLSPTATPSSITSPIDPSSTLPHPNNILW
ncbi:hypothetical protein PGT21_015710 [Puccinia graminis f. sp. tritici]|uniref:Uncharacterized protein n=1 Tax=Puccinia graminis f. sp. tritici TaxID=56615 RepID=A0A5B0LRM7_PUCGR|nr:hypothetical protein PGTUg99_006646 [Puccinia graminis f. sp. tritici]KAA1071680.1 hypothetical protein PGT21_015710 [Puccinia graminis f. sp. tritici]